jgi:hypothetical protein
MGDTITIAICDGASVLDHSADSEVSAADHIRYVEWPLRVPFGELSDVNPSIWREFEMDTDHDRTRVAVHARDHHVAYEVDDLNIAYLIGVDTGAGWSQIENPLYKYVVEPPPVDYSTLAARLRRHIPGLRQRVPFPCNCGPGSSTVWQVIQHLNDFHHPTNPEVADAWDRERIAQWTENLPIDLTFDPNAPVSRVSQRKPTDQDMELIKKMADDLHESWKPIFLKFADIGEHATETAKHVKEFAEKFYVELHADTSQMEEVLSEQLEALNQKGLVVTKEET